VRLVDYVAPPPTVQEPSRSGLTLALLLVGLSLVEQTVARSRAFAVCVRFRVRSEYVRNYTDITGRLDVFAVPCCVRLYIIAKQLI